MSDLEIIQWEYGLLMKNKLELELVNKTLDYEDNNRLQRLREAYDIFKPRFTSSVAPPTIIRKEEVPF